MTNQFKGAKVLYIIFALVIFSLIFNIFYIGATGKHLISGAEIESFSKTRGIQREIMQAERGEIYSSEGEIIATNVKKYKLIAYTSSTRMGVGNVPAHVSDARKTAEQVAPLIGMDVVEMAVRLQNAIDNGTYQIEFGTFGSSLTSLVVDQIKETELPGLDFVGQTSRNYPRGNFASHIIGYAQMEENKSIESIVGKMGLELTYNDSLSGKNGFREYQVDANRNPLPNGILEEEKTVNGNTMHLTINASLQRDLDIQLAAAAAATRAESATAAVMEAKTGKILALSNYPSFDPNDREITNYRNFFFEQSYESGSVFKPFVYANAMEDGNYNGHDTFQSGRYNVYEGTPIHDWNEGRGWGRISYHEGMVRSSNVAIANLVDNADLKSLEEDYEKLGFFNRSTINGFDSPAGVAGFRNNPGRLEYITTGYGQGSTVTPLQLLRAYSVFANDGRTVEPYFIDRIVDPNTNEVVYSASPEYSEQVYSTETVQQMNNLLLDNIYSENSVAKDYRLDNENIKLIGKTGTGQISQGASGYRNDIYSMSFAGLAPYEDPEIVIMVTFQCSRHNTTPIIGDLVKNIVPAALATKASYTSSVDTTINGYEVDSFANQSVSFVRSKLEAKQMGVEVIGTGTSVISQFPEPGTKINVGDRIFIKTNSDQIVIPNMVGWSRKDVSIYANLSGLDIEMDGETGLVTKQSIAEGTVLNNGETFSVTLQ
jgi:penicillin-binding protein 2B